MSWSSKIIDAEANHQCGDNQLVVIQQLCGSTGIVYANNWDHQQEKDGQTEEHQLPPRNNCVSNPLLGRQPIRDHSTKKLKSINKQRQVILGTPLPKSIKIKGSLGCQELCSCQQLPISGNSVHPSANHNCYILHFLDDCKSKIPKQVPVGVHCWDQEGHSDLDHTTFSPIYSFTITTDTQSVVDSKANPFSSNPVEGSESGKNNGSREGQDSQQKKSMSKKSPFSKNKNKEQNICKVDLSQNSSNANQSTAKQDHGSHSKKMKPTICATVKNLTNAFNNHQIVTVNQIDITYYPYQQQQQHPTPSLSLAAPLKPLLVSHKSVSIKIQLDDSPLVLLVPPLEQKSMTKKYVKVEESMHVNDPDLDCIFVNSEKQETMRELMRVLPGETHRQTGRSQQKQRQFQQSYNRGGCTNSFVQKCEHHCQQNPLEMDGKLVQLSQNEDSKFEQVTLSLGKLAKGSITHWNTSTKQISTLTEHQQSELNAGKNKQLFYGLYAESTQLQSNHSKMVKVSAIEVRTTTNDDIDNSLKIEGNQESNCARNKIKVFIRSKHHPQHLTIKDAQSVLPLSSQANENIQNNSNTIKNQIIHPITKPCSTVCRVSLSTPNYCSTQLHQQQHYFIHNHPMLINANQNQCYNSNPAHQMLDNNYDHCHCQSIGNTNALSDEEREIPTVPPCHIPSQMIQKDDPNIWDKKLSNNELFQSQSNPIRNSLKREDSIGFQSARGLNDNNSMISKHSIKETSNKNIHNPFQSTTTKSARLRGWQSSGEPKKWLKMGQTATQHQGEAKTLRTHRIEDDKSPTSRTFNQEWRGSGIFSERSPSMPNDELRDNCRNNRVCERRNNSLYRPQGSVEPSKQRSSQNGKLVQLIKLSSVARGERCMMGGNIESRKSRKRLIDLREEVRKI